MASFSAGDPNASQPIGCRALQPFVSRPAIRKDVTAPVAHVEPGPGRVGKHVQAVILWPRIFIPRFMQPVGYPVFTPLWLNFSMFITFVRHDQMIIAYRLARLLSGAYNTDLCFSLLDSRTNRSGRHFSASTILRILNG